MTHASTIMEAIRAEMCNFEWTWMNTRCNFHALDDWCVMHIMMHEDLNEIWYVANEHLEKVFVPSVATKSKYTDAALRWLKLLSVQRCCSERTRQFTVTPRLPVLSGVRCSAIRFWPSCHVFLVCLHNGDWMGHRTTTTALWRNSSDAQSQLTWRRLACGPRVHCNLASILWLELREIKDFALVCTLTMLPGKDVSAPKITAKTEQEIRSLAYTWPRSKALYWPILCFKMEWTAPNTAIFDFLGFGQRAVPMLACCWRLDQESR